MKKSIRILPAFIITTFCAGLLAGTFAAASETIEPRPIEALDASVVIDVSDVRVTKESAPDWAYKNYVQASGTEKANILKARLLMLEQSDWAADGTIAYYTAPDGTRERIPSFSEVFPDWDFGQINAFMNAAIELAANNEAYQAGSIALSASRGGRDPSLDYSDADYYYQNHSRADFNAQIPVMVQGTNAPTVYTTTMLTTVSLHKTTINSLSGCGTCGIGYIAHVSKEGYLLNAYKQDIPAGGSFEQMYIPVFEPTDTLDVRVSSLTTAGYGSFTHADFWVNPR